MMPPFEWLVIGTLLALPILVLRLARRDEREVERDWQILLGGKAEEIYGEIEGELRTELIHAEFAYHKAARLQMLGSTEEARQLLVAGYRVIERFSPTLLKLLSTMANFSRMVAAITPLPPLRPHDFRVSELVSLAYLGLMIHQFARSSGERFRLRLFVIGQSVSLAGRYLLETTNRILHGKGEEEQAWEQVEAVREDLETLTAESLSSLRALLMALDRERKLASFPDSQKP